MPAYVVHTVVKHLSVSCLIMQTEKIGCIGNNPVLSTSMESSSRVLFAFIPWKSYICSCLSIFYVSKNGFCRIWWYSIQVQFASPVSQDFWNYWGSFIILYRLQRVQGRNCKQKCCSFGDDDQWSLFFIRPINFTVYWPALSLVEGRIRRWNSSGLFHSIIYRSTRFFCKFCAFYATCNRSFSSVFYVLVAYLSLSEKSQRK